jgi:hypothetical protein
MLRKFVDEILWSAECDPLYHKKVMKEVMLPSGKRMDAKVFMQNRVGAQH